MNGRSLATALLPDIRLGVVRGTTYGLFGAPGEFVPQARALGARIVRVNIYWAQVEPEPGQFVWDAVDALLDQLDERDEAWVTVCCSSRWATQRRTGWLPAAPAVDIDRYRRFVGELASRRPGAVRFWQCEIEPCLPLFWAGTAEEYLAQLRVFHEAVRRADPDALVVLGAAVPGAMLGDGQAGASTWTRFMGQVLREAAAHFDVFDVHPYGDPYMVPSLVQTCRAQMAAHGYDKPVVVGENGGPLPPEFPANMPFLADVLVANQLQFLGEVTMPDTLESLDAAEDAAVAALYDRMNTLPSTLQMFMIGCSAELDDTRHRLACEDLVIRTVLALSADVRRNLYYRLAPEPQLNRDSRVAPALMFGKLELMDCDGDAIGPRHPAADTFELMARHLDGVERVDRIPIADRPDLYLFDILRVHRPALLIAWERRGALSGDQPPAELTCGWSHSSAHAVDMFGADVPTVTDHATLRFPVSPTPTFIEAPRWPTPMDSDIRQRT
ncbi:hypothetical protein [Nocardia cyriacigeorgica]|uniref:Uncharacterized protein n=1 Tax=Nocardia cyriacigeorgica TaxID=135487 RepID=A0A6P1DBN9_9NOCA|nr:hypothetical protein [Nocardia cyriacigeorgica]NEW48175.1 hypothetical protein [Nocardia cyriacigeorgica]